MHLAKRAKAVVQSAQKERGVFINFVPNGKMFSRGKNAIDKCPKIR
jgi:hypothetical protein